MRPQTVFIWGGQGKYAPLFGGGAVISSSIELREADLSSFGHICLLAELDWAGRRFLEFYGFEVLRRLRVEHGLRCPITIYSFMPEEYFLRVASTSTPLDRRRAFVSVSLPGHSFRLLPQASWEGEGADETAHASLTDEELDHAVVSLYDAYILKKQLGTPQHPGYLVHELRSIICSLELFRDGDNSILSGIPFNNGRALAVLLRGIALMIRFLDASGFLERLPPKDGESLRSGLESSSPVQRLFGTLLRTSTDFEQRIRTLEKFDLDNVIDALGCLLEAFQKVEVG